MALQPDGRIVVAGFSAGGNIEGTHFLAARFTPLGGEGRWISGASSLDNRLRASAVPAILIAALGTQGFDLIDSGRKPNARLVIGVRLRLQCMGRGV
jgi:hypothetical protein